MTDRSKHYIVVSALLALAAIASVAILLGNDSDTAAAVVEPEQRRAFGVLRHDPEPPPPALAEAMEEVVEGPGIQLRTDGAQKVRTRIGIDVWVVPGAGVVCVIGGSPLVAGCDTTERTIRRGMSAVAIVPSPLDPAKKRYLLFGIAPDGVPKVAIRTDGGRRAEAETVYNVYSYEAPTMIHARLLR